MPANTLNDMILGYALIFGILLLYTLSLILRTQSAKRKNKDKQ